MFAIGHPEGALEHLQLAALRESIDRWYVPAQWTTHSGANGLPSPFGVTAGRPYADEVPSLLFLPDTQFGRGATIVLSESHDPLVFCPTMSPM